jgi:hypothetical protein
MAIAIKLLLAEDTLAAGDIEGHEDVVADFQFFHLLSDLFHYACDLVTERHSDTSIWHGAVV